MTRSLHRTAADHLYNVTNSAEDSARELINLIPATANRNVIESVLKRQYEMVVLLKHVIHYLIVSFVKDYSFTIRYANSNGRQDLSREQRSTIKHLKKVLDFCFLLNLI